MGGEIFRTCPDRPWGPPSLLYNGYRVFPGGKERSWRDPDPSPPSSWSGKSRATPLLSLWAVRPVQSLSAGTRVHFTFTFYHTHFRPQRVKKRKLPAVKDPCLVVAAGLCRIQQTRAPPVRQVLLSSSLDGAGEGPTDSVQTR